METTNSNPPARVDTGGVAFPTEPGHYVQLPHGFQEWVQPLHGMTLLDHFAGLAMQGLLADPEDLGAAEGMTCEQTVAELAYRHALEMIKVKRRLENTLQK